MAAKKRKALRRRTLGINVLVGKASPTAHLIYQVDWSDGTTTVEKGTSLKTMLSFEHLNGTKAERKRARGNYYPYFYHVLIAVATLLGPVEHACYELDDRLFGKEAK